MTTIATSVAASRSSGRNVFDILIYADGVELTGADREAVARKIGRVRQHAPRAFRTRVRLTRLLTARAQKQFRAHVLYELPGNDIAAEHTAHDPMAAVDLVAEKIERRLRKRKTARLARRVPRGRERAPFEV